MEKLEKIKLAISTYLSKPDITISEVSKITGISTSSIQRYLNDKSLVDILNKDELELLKQKKINNLNMGKKKGGLNYSKNNTAIKDNNGKFIGSKVGNINNNVKTTDILNLYKLIIVGGISSLSELAGIFNKLYKKDVTRDYVYDCLTSNNINNVLNEEDITNIKLWLSSNKEKGNKKGADITNSRKH